MELIRVTFLRNEQINEILRIVKKMIAFQAMSSFASHTRGRVQKLPLERLDPPTRKKSKATSKKNKKKPLVTPIQ